ncbi:MAG TPA: tripartite tricarboxylate transporter substrate-binding protein [Burkholderiales bacterium]
MKILQPLLALFLMAFAQALYAQAYPIRHVTMIVPFPPGGPTDVYGRAVAEAMARALGHAVVVENVPGAGSTIGTGRAAAAAPDGYTLLLLGPSLPIASALYGNLPYDPVRDLAGVGLVNYGPQLIVGRKDLPATDIAGLVKWMKEPGRRVRFAHAGVGSLAHLCGVLFADLVKVEVDHVPYRGSGPALNDVIGGHVDLTCAGLSAGQYVRSGALKGYGVTSRERSGALPGIESFVQAGYPAMDINSWHALFTRSGAPAPVLARLNDALRQALKDPKVISTFERTGVLIYPASEQTPEAASGILRSEIKRWGELIREHNIAPSS